MKKKVILLIVIALLLVVSLFIFAYFTIWNDVDVSIEEFYMKTYPEIKLDEKKYKELKKEYDSEEVGEGREFYQLGKKYENMTSSVFSVDITMKLKRKSSFTDYKVALNIDGSELEDSEKIFVSGYRVDSPRDWFFGTFFEEGQEGRMGCYLYGKTCGKSQEEIEKILKKFNFILTFEDEKGRIIEKSISLKDTKLIIEQPNEDDIETMKDRYER